MIFAVANEMALDTVSQVWLVPHKWLNLYVLAQGRTERYFARQSANQRQRIERSAQQRPP